MKKKENKFSKCVSPCVQGSCTQKYDSSVLANISIYCSLFIILHFNILETCSKSAEARVSIKWVATVNPTATFALKKTHTDLKIGRNQSTYQAQNVQAICRVSPCMLLTNTVTVDLLFLLINYYYLLFLCWTKVWAHKLTERLVFLDTNFRNKISFKSHQSEQDH